MHSAPQSFILNSTLCKCTSVYMAVSVPQFTDGTHVEEKKDYSPFKMHIIPVCTVLTDLFISCKLGLNTVCPSIGLKI